MTGVSSVGETHAPPKGSLERRARLTPLSLALRSRDPLSRCRRQEASLISGGDRILIWVSSKNTVLETYCVSRDTNGVSRDTYCVSRDTYCVSSITHKVYKQVSKWSRRGLFFLSFGRVQMDSNLFGLWTLQALIFGLNSRGLDYSSAKKVRPLVPPQRKNQPLCFAPV